MTLRIDNSEYGNVIRCDFCGGCHSATNDEEIEDVKARGWTTYNDQNLCIGCIIKISDTYRMGEMKYLIKEVLQEELEKGREKMRDKR